MWMAFPTEWGCHLLHQQGWRRIALQVFILEANTCDNHFLGIQAANYSQRKYFLSQQNYDKFYDVMVRIQKISMEIVCNKAHDLVESFMVDELNDTRAWDWWSRNWSMESGFGRWSICHGGYSGYASASSNIQSGGYYSGGYNYFSGMTSFVKYFLYKYL
jgi:hypothetical protein